MASAAIISLSLRDNAVLGALFDPEASLRNPVYVDNTLPEPYEDDVLSIIKEQESVAIKMVDGSLPSESVLNLVIEELSCIINDYPRYASAWNNRAQALRMRAQMTESIQDPGQIKAIYSDLSTAIELASNNGSQHTASRSIANVLASAHTHRAYILWQASRPGANHDMLRAIEGLRDTSMNDIEELASRDFLLGGRYGNEAAQQLAVKTNPYAKLCGSIVREAIQKEIESFSSQHVAE